MNDRYKLIEKPDSEFFFVQLLQGEFTGLTVRYNTVRFEEDPIRDQLAIKFDYEVIEKPNEFSEADLRASGKLTQQLGEIIFDILSGSFATNRYKFGRPRHDSQHGRSSNDDTSKTGPR